jgi:NADPH:quinone reductase-like Zn-dependent oxidoreductase
MKVSAISDFSTPPAVQDKADPEAGDGQVVVDVEFASINGMDLGVWAGYMKDYMPYEMPLTLGRDFAGTVSAVGAGVTDLAVGDEVFGALATPDLYVGTFAEKIPVAAATVAKRPQGLDAKTAAALALAGTAARTAIDALALQSGETILISGATGGVGAIAVQLAKKAGATVIATAKPDRAEFVSGLGADQTVDYSDDLAAAVAAVAPDGVDAVLHAAGDPVALVDLVKPGGRMASVLGFGQDAVGDRDVTATPIMSIPSPQSLGALADLAASGELQVPITTTYALDEVADGLMAFASGKHGKLVVAIR